MKYKKIKPADGVSAGARELHSKRIKRALGTAAVFVVVFGFFQAMVKLEVKAVYPAYLAITLVLLVVFLFLNKGFSATPTAEQLPQEWGDEEKRRILHRLARDKAAARVVLIFLIPFLLTFLLDYIILFIPELISNG